MWGGVNAEGGGGKAYVGKRLGFTPEEFEVRKIWGRECGGKGADVVGAVEKRCGGGWGSHLSSSR